MTELPKETTSSGVAPPSKRKSRRVGRDARWKYGLFAILAGFVVIFACFALAVFKYGNNAADAVAVTSPAIAAISTLAGAYFGVNAGAAARSEEEEE